MRAIRTTTISILALGLLAGSAVGVVAQDEAEADLATPSYYTFTVGEPTSVTEGTMDEDTGELRGIVLEGIPIDASDPRASGVASIVINGNSEGHGGPDGEPEGRGVIESRAYRVVNDEGAWVGTGTYVIAGGPFSEEPDIQREMAVLVGEGGYTGLISVTTSDYAEGNSGEGVILGVSVPPVPDLSAE